MSPLSHGELVQMEEAAKNKPGVRGGKVPFPIVVDTDTIFEEVRNDLDEKITQAVVNVGITVNKADLIRALELDKELREGKLVEVVRCKECRFFNDAWGICKHDNSIYHEDGFCSLGERRSHD